MWLAEKAKPRQGGWLPTKAKKLKHMESDYLHFKLTRLMKNYNYVKIGLFYLIFSSLSCIKNAIPKTLPEDFSTWGLSIQYGVNEIEIIDKRLGVTSDQMDLPKLAVKTRSFEANPQLTIDQTIKLKNQIKGYFSLSDSLEKVNVKLTLTEGSKKITSSATRVSEHTKVNIEIELYNSNGNELSRGFGTVRYDIPMINATEDHLDKVFDISLKNAVYTCFEKLSEYNNSSK